MKRPFSAAPRSFDIADLPSNCSSAEQPATALCKSHPQSDTILNLDLVAADPDFCAQCWRTSKDCQHVIQVFLSLRVNSIPGHSRLADILALELPPLLMLQNQKDAFLVLLQREKVSDVKLLDAFNEFLATWTRPVWASYRDLLADANVDREAAALLPATVPLWMWIQERLRGQINLVIGCGPHGNGGWIWSNQTGDWIWRCTYQAGDLAAEEAWFAEEAEKVFLQMPSAVARRAPRARRAVAARSASGTCSTSSTSSSDSESYPAWYRRRRTGSTYCSAVRPACKCDGL